MPALNLNNLESQKRGAANSHKRYDAKGQSTRDLMGTQRHFSSEKGGDTKREHSYLMPGNQCYEPPAEELQIRLALFELPSELQARGFTVRVKPAGHAGGGGINILPTPRRYYWRGKSYVGFSVR